MFFARPQRLLSVTAVLILQGCASSGPRLYSAGGEEFRSKRP